LPETTILAKFYLRVAVTSYLSIGPKEWAIRKRHNETNRTLCNFVWPNICFYGRCCYDVRVRYQVVPAHYDIADGNAEEEVNSMLAAPNLILSMNRALPTCLETTVQ